MKNTIFEFNFQKGNPIRFDSIQNIKRENASRFLALKFHIVRLSEGPCFQNCVVFIMILFREGFYGPK